MSNGSVPFAKTSQYTTVIHYLSIYALILIIVGTAGNLLTLIVLLRRHLRRFVTVHYLIAVSVCDLISLYGWNLNNFYKFNISPVNGNIEDLSLVHCRLISFMTFVALQLSSWCLSAVSLGKTKCTYLKQYYDFFFILVERALSLYWPAWRQSYGRIRYTKYYILVISLVCIALNSHILFLNGYRRPSGGIVCYSTRSNPNYIYPQWERVHLVFYNLFPFTIMCISNAYIIYVTVRSSPSGASAETNKHGRKSLEKYRQFTALLIIVTFAFVILTLPACIYFVFFRHAFASTAQRNVRFMIQILLNSIQFTSHGINFFLYCFSASSFRLELREMFQELIYTFSCCGCRYMPNDNRRQNVRYHNNINKYISPLERKRLNHGQDKRINHSHWNSGRLTTTK